MPVASFGDNSFLEEDSLSFCQPPGMGGGEEARIVKLGPGKEKNAD